MTDPDAPGVPRFSVVTPVCDPTPNELRALWESLQAQEDPSWHWCIADDASTDPDVLDLVGELEADRRVSVVRHESRLGIVAATNAASGLATGVFVAFVDHDDVLHAAALAAVTAAIIDEPDADVLYTDEDVLDPDGGRVAPFYKPAWSPERLRSQHYIGHLTVVRRSLLAEAGGLRPGFDGSQDLDLLLRLSERTDRFVKVPGVLYHWRATPRSVAGDPEAKPYAYEAALRSLAEHCERVGIVATIRHLVPLGRYAVVRTPADVVAISVVVLDRGPGSAADLEAQGRLVGGLAGAELIVVPAAGFAGVAAARNAGAALATGEVLVFLDADCRAEADAAAWQHVGALALEAGVGVVGLANRLADGSVLDAGMVLGPARAVPLLADFPADADHNRGDLAVARETSAIGAGTVVVSAAMFGDLGGFAESMSDDDSVLDLCLKARLSGSRVLWSPLPVVEFPVGRRRAVPVAPYGDAFADRWRHWLRTDPYYTSDVRLGRAHYVPGVGYPD